MAPRIRVNAGAVGRIGPSAAGGLMSEAVCLLDARDFPGGTSQYLTDKSGFGNHAKLGSSVTQSLVTTSGTVPVVQPSASTRVQTYPKARASTEFEYRVAFRSNSYNSGGFQTLGIQYDGPTSNCGFFIYWDPVGRFLVGFSAAGTNLDSVSYFSPGPSVTNGVTVLCVKMTRVSSTGATNIYTKTSTEATAATDLENEVGWTVVGAPTNILAGQNIYASTAAIQIGHAFGANPVDGNVYAASYRTTIGGVPCAVFNPSGLVGLNQWVDSYGSTWTVMPNGSDTNEPLFLPYAGTPYVYFPGIAGNSLSIADGAAAEPTTELDLRMAAKLDDWTPAALTGLFSKWGSVGQLQWFLGVQPDSTLILYLSWDGTSNNNVASSAPIGAADGTLAAFRVTWRSSDGQVQFLSKATSESSAKADCRSNSGWTPIGTTRTLGTGLSIFNSTTRTGICDWGAGFSGKFFYAQQSNAIDAAPVLSFDPSLATSPFTSWTSAEGLTVTVNRASSGRKTCVVTRPVFLFGTDDYMEIPDSDTLDFGPSDSFTLAYAARIFGAQSSYARMVSKEVVSGAGFSYYLLNTGRRPVLSVTDGTTVRYSSSASGDASGDYSDGVAALFSAARNGSGSKNIYTGKNGATTTTTTDTTTGTLANSSVLRLGAGSYSAVNYLDHEFLGAAVFRRALTASELTEVANYFGVA